MYRLTLFGGASIDAPGDDDVPPRARQRHRLALLALLAVEGRGLSRQKLIGYLWPEREEKRARNLLSVSLYVLRGALGEETIVSAGDEVELDRERIGADVIDFEQAIEDGDHGGAADLYEGPFLDGFFLSDAPEFEHWSDRQRRRFARAYADALEALALAAEASDDIRAAVRWWRKRVAHDRFDSRVTLRLMEALEAAGNRAGALELAGIHAKLLREEFGTEPDPDVRRLADRLRDAPSGIDVRADPVDAAPTDDGPVDDGSRRPAPPRDEPEPRRRASRATEAGRRPGPARWRRPTRVAAVVLGAVTLAIGVWLGWPEGPVEDSVAVLPFDNLSPDPDDAYFAAGIHEEILTQLSRIDGIRLISRTSVLRYEDTEKSLPEIAEELDASVILEGSVQRVDDEVRIAVQLNDARTDEHLWARSYDRELSDIFDIQTDVSTRIVEEVRGVLTPEERAELARRPTDDLEAYAHYLRGNEHFSRYFESVEQWRAAAQAYERAVELDPTFEAAWARLVRTRLSLAFHHYDFGERAQARAALERLEELAPDSPELRLARGLWLKNGEERPREALREFEVLAELWPGDVEVMKERGWLYLVLGRWEEGLRAREEVFELDPADATSATRIAQTYLMMRRFEEAERYAQVAVSLEPGDPFAWGYLIWARLSRGDTTAARSAVDSAGRHLGDEAIDSRWAWGWALYQYFTGGTTEVLELYRKHPMTYTTLPDLGLAVAAAEGEGELVELYADTLRNWARAMLSSAPPEYVEVRSQALLHLALVEAYLGSEEAAVRLADEAVRLYPVSRNAWFGPRRVLWQAHVYTVVGRHDDAVDRLRHLLSIPADMVTVPQLRMDLRWDPLRDHPGFQALLEE